MRPRFPQLWWVVVAALALLAFVSILATQSVEASAINVPSSIKAQSGSTDIQSTGNKSKQEQPTHTLNRDIVPTADVETERRFNELWREVLDGRAATAIFLTLIGVGAAILVYFGFKKSDRIENAEVADKDSEKASKIIENVRQNSGSTLIDKAVAAAVSLQQQDKIEEAIRKWTSIADLSEGINNNLAARAWFSVGYLMSSKNNDSEGAIEAYDKSIKLNSNYYEAYNNRGHEKTNLGLYESAISDYDKTIVLKPDYAESYNNRGNMKLSLGQYNSAISDYDKAIVLKSDYAEPYNNRGIAKVRLDQHQSAIIDYDKAIALKSDYAEAYYNRGNIKFKLGQHQSAINDYDKAIVLKSDYAEPYNNRG